jgi:hypothetical protein
LKEDAMRIGQVGDVVRAHEAAENPVMLWSPPGVGKSSVVAQMCKEDEVENVDIRLSLLNPVDLRGIPIVKGDRVEWVPPVFLVNRGPCRFFLDEINVAPPTTQAAAYQWVLDGRIGEWAMDRTLMTTKSGLKRPKQTIIAAGNRASDQAFVHQMPAPLRNRLAHVEVEPHLDDWKDWAWANGIDSRIINFLQFTARVGVGINTDSQWGLLFFFDPKVHATGSFPTPRSWAQVSRFVQANPRFATNVEAVAGMVGGAVAQKFVAFLKVADKLPNADLILDGDMGISPPREPSALYAFCGAITAALIRREAKARIKATENVAQYCVKHWAEAAEFAILTMKDYGRTPEYKEVYRQVLSSSGWRNFSKCFGSLLEV